MTKKDTDSGQVIVIKKCQPEAELNLKDTIVFIFQEFPGRGYSWNFTLLDSTGSTLKPAGIKKYTQQDFDDASQTVEFRFTGTTKGNTTLKFFYSRPWEKTKPAFDSCVTRIRVK